MSVLLRGGRAGLGGRAADVHVRDGRVAAVEPVGTLDARDLGAEVVALGDATVLPGVVDAHVHVDQWVHRARRVDLAPATDRDAAVRLLHAARGTDPQAGRARALTGHGFHDAAWPQPPHRDVLDAVFGELPVAAVSHDLHLAWLNGAALALTGHDGHPTGLLREDACLVAVRALMDAEPAAVVDGWVREALTGAAALGVTGLVDFEYADTVTTWRRRAEAGQPVRVAAAVWLPWLDAIERAGLRTGDPLAADGSAVVGPFKVMADGSLNSRTAHCHDPYPGDGPESPAGHGLATVSVDELEAQLRRARRAGLTPAVHAIGDAAASTALDAFERAGVGGRIEHAQLLRDHDVRRFADAGVTASVQPQHAVADRDVAERLWPGRTGRAFPYAALHAAGVRLLLGSDAPVSPLDPWAAIADAVARTGDDRPPWHPEQALGLADAVSAACDGRCGLRPGDPADLTVVAGDLAHAEVDAVRRTRVLATMLAGRLTHRAV